jgi:S-adenosyl methyltransferase
MTEFDLSDGLRRTTGPEVSGLPYANITLNTHVPHSARIYDYLLGGKDNFEADRAAAATIVEAAPGVVTSMRANRDFMRRVAHHMAAELGFRQFLDIGTGLPASQNLHEVVQAVAPDSRVVYADNDPIVLAHGRALLRSRAEGKTVCINGDLRNPEAILEAAGTRETLDLGKPVAVSLIAVLHLILDDEEAHRIIDTLMGALPPGSALALSLVTADSAPGEASAGVAAFNASGIPIRARGQAEVEALFRGLDLIEPGVVLVNHWMPDDLMPAFSDTQVHLYGGLALKR